MIRTPPQHNTINPPGQTINKIPLQEDTWKPCRDLGYSHLQQDKPLVKAIDDYHELVRKSNSEFSR